MLSNQKDYCYQKTRIFVVVYVDDIIFGSNLTTLRKKLSELL
jgi:hypothetical protein